MLKNELDKLEQERKIWISIADWLIIFGTALGLAILIVLWLLFP